MSNTNTDEYYYFYNNPRVTVNKNTLQINEREFQITDDLEVTLGYEQPNLIQYEIASLSENTDEENDNTQQGDLVSTSIIKLPEIYWIYSVGILSFIAGLTLIILESQSVITSLHWLSASALFSGVMIPLVFFIWRHKKRALLWVSPNGSSSSSETFNIPGEEKQIDEIINAVEKSKRELKIKTRGEENL